MTQLIAHTVIVVCLLAAAVVLAALGHDATPAWAGLGGYIGGGTVSTVATSKAP